MTCLRQPVAANATEPFRLALLPNEFWWGGAVHDGIHMPFRHHSFQRDLNHDFGGNQAAPLLLSSQGRFLWSEGAFHFAFENDHLLIWNNRSEIVYSDGYENLRGAYRAACWRFFTPGGRMPDALNFTAPQYNSWIEMQYEPTQAKVLRFAREILAHGLPPGVLMIDDNWFEDHGDWRFHPGRFPDPAAMIRQLHAEGFRVLVWISPFVSPDSAVYRFLAGRGLLVRDGCGTPVIRKWWNGQSAMLDVTHPDALSWLYGRLAHLMETWEVDGFKFDAGDPEYYSAEDHAYRCIDGVAYCEAWARLGLRYRFNEYRACWKLGGQPLIQRLRDTEHAWGGSGLGGLIPNGLAQGLSGYAFTCPDMIGGGDIACFLHSNFQLDQELFVRTAQCSALFPIMQFSVAPWRVLDKVHQDYCLAAVRLRQSLAPEIVRLAEEAARSGEPILRHMQYAYPGCGFERISDQFLLGERLLVAPVLTKGATKRRVAFPPGLWEDEEGCVFEGMETREIEAPLARLPWYRKIT